jgi:hypothetical protein
MIACPHSLCGFCFGFSPYALRLTIYGTKYTLCALPHAHALCTRLFLVLNSAIRNPHLEWPPFLWTTPFLVL